MDVIIAADGSWRIAKGREVLKDGERLVVHRMVDSAGGRPTFDAAPFRPGFRGGATVAVAEAYEAGGAWVRDAWRSPGSKPTQPVPVTREQAWRDAGRALSEAWRNP